MKKCSKLYTEVLIKQAFYGDSYATPEDAPLHALQESNPVFEEFLPGKRITMDKISPSIHL